jgi:CubicO group peptidase (beta-lactamase class C family)
MQFKGLVFTDALGMQGVSAYNSAGDIALKAFKAGTDMLLMPPDIESAVKGIKNALSAGLITEKEIDDRCYKILQAKKWVGLDQNKPIEIKHLIEDLNNQDARYVNQKVIESALTLVENKNEIVPIGNIDSISVASVSIGSGKSSVFQNTLSLYDDVIHFSIDKNADISAYRSLLNKLCDFDVVILAFQKSNYSPSSFGITSNSIWLAHELTKYTKVIIDVFASPYILSRFNRESFHGIIVSYEDNETSQDLSAQLIYGGIPAKGKLPVSGGKNYPVGSGLMDERIRLKYALPKEVKIEETKLKKIDSIILSAIHQGAFPGCQILAAKNGLVFFNKSYGFQTYEKKSEVSNDDVFDLASITKIAATLPIVMRLYEDGKLSLDDKLSKYFPEFNNPEKKNIDLKQVLAHQAGFISWIPFYLRTFILSGDSTPVLNPKLYQQEPDSIFSLRVAENMYMNNSYVDTIYKRIYNSPVRKKPKYRYSDLGFYLFYKLINEKLHINFQDYVDNQFYKSLGLSTFCFNPIDKFPIEKIVPTENDKKFRNQLIQGYVHDYGAAMMGGIGGHAGLFSNANDLAKLMQMYLQKGEYGGIHYLNPGTIETFTSNAYTKTKNRRALGFDKPGLDKKSPVSKMASPFSYGHKGFSGTMVWVDPKEQFVFVFLSNRIYPSVENDKINDLQVRTKVHEVFYKSFL